MDEFQSDIFDSDDPSFNLDDFMEQLSAMKEYCEAKNNDNKGVRGDFESKDLSMMTPKSDDDKLERNSGLSDADQAMSSDGVSASSGSDAHPSTLEAGPHKESSETLLVTEEESSDTNPVYNWSDDKIDDGEFEGFPMLSVDQTIKLGEIMLIMVCQGPLRRLEEIVTALALNLRDPADLTARVFTAVEGGDPPAPGTHLYDIASPATIQELQNLCEVQKYRIEEKEYNKIRSRRIEDENRIEEIRSRRIKETNIIEEYNLIRKRRFEDRKRIEEISKRRIEDRNRIEEIRSGRIKEINIMEECNKISSRRLEDRNRIEEIRSRRINNRNIIEEYNKIRNRRKEDKNIIEGKGTETEFYNSRCAIKELMYETSEISDEGRAALFCFMAASLVRCGVKNRKAMNELWSKSLLKFNYFYNARNYDRRKLILSRPAYQMLNRGFRPESVLLKTVLRSFLKKSRAPDVPDKVFRVLDFTLLTHTRYNGMRLVTLVSDALKTLGKEKINDLQLFDTEENRSGIATLEKHFISRCEGQPLHGSKYLPWCRLFDRNYCSDLSPKDHPSLAILLMCLIENTKTDIWNTRSVRATEECKTESKKIAKQIIQDTTQACNFKIFFRYRAEKTNQP